MDKIREAVAAAEGKFKGTVSTQPVDESSNKGQGQGQEAKFSAFNTRGGPPPIPEGVSAQQEGDKAARDKLAAEWNKKQ